VQRNSSVLNGEKFHEPYIQKCHNNNNINNNNTQDQALQTKYHVTKVLETEPDSKCRFIWQTDETVEHIISACPTLAKEQYVKRHDTVCAQLHFNIHKEIGVKSDNEQRHDHVPKYAETSHKGTTTILFNQQVLADRTNHNNKPDIITRDNKKKHAW
jgi:hypothetical protein